MKTRNQAFTLVELLVVIGIIALLISILLPALGRVRSTARMMECTARMRQLTAACLMYANDNKGFLPPMAASYDNNNHYIRPTIFPAGGECYLTIYLGKRRPGPAVNPNPAGATIAAARLYCCPELDKDSSTTLSSGYSFRYNGYLGGRASLSSAKVMQPMIPWKIASVKQASNYALWCESDSLSGAISDNQRFFRESAYKQHSFTGAESMYVHMPRRSGGAWKAYWSSATFPIRVGMTNIGYVDGSVRSVPIAIDRSPLPPLDNTFIDPNYPMASW